MDNVGIYAGSFNPFHVGHLDILTKATKMFDRVILFHYTFADGRTVNKRDINLSVIYDRGDKSQLLPSIINEYEDINDYKLTIVRGVRNGYDLDYEFALNRTYNEIAGREIPFVLIPASPELSHVSSTMIRSLVTSGNKKEAERYIV